MEYPVARRDESVVDDYHGVQIVDPYRWMEKQTENPELEEWIGKEQELFKGFMQDTQKDVIKEELLKSYNYEKYGCPFKRGERYFYYYNSGIQNQSVLFVQDALDAEARVFLDPNTWSEDGTVSISAQAFSECGSLFAYGVSKSGSDLSTLNVMEVATGKKLDDEVKNVKYSGISWTHDNKGFFYSRYPAEIADKSSDLKDHKLYYHKVGTDQAEDVLVLEIPENPTWLISGEVSDDGNYLLISVSESCKHANRLYFARLTDLSLPDQLEIVKVIDNNDYEYSYVTNVGEVFFFTTDNNAPKCRLISINFASFQPEEWKEVIAESEKDVLNFIYCLNENKLVACYMRDVAQILLVFDLEGKLLSEIALPTLGSIGGLSGHKKQRQMFFKFTSFTYPGTIFTYDLETQEQKVFKETVIEGFEASAFVTKQVFFPSKDGTKIPMFIIHPSSLELNGNSPTILYGYGGFQISINPSFSTTRCNFLAGYNAVYAIANIRGGAEYGVDWHKGGILENKQNSYDDFIGAAEYLIKEGYTNSNKLAILGGSNGGLLVAACMNQRPDLFRAVVSQVGVLDLLRYHKFTIGYMWASDYGLSDNPDQFPFIFKISPLHNLRSDNQYPALLLTTADHDDRVVPGHSFKFAAQIQHLNPNNQRPLLIRIESKAGHGAGKPTDKVMEEIAEIYAFIGKVTESVWTTAK